jgi:hypothetical protein
MIDDDHLPYCHLCGTSAVECDELSRQGDAT